MVEPRILWSCGKLYIWTSEFNLEHYSQTCSNGHLRKMTNAESAQANSCWIVTVQDDHLSNTTTLIKKLTDINQCLTNPAYLCLTDINQYYISYFTYPVLVILNW